MNIPERAACFIGLPLIQGLLSTSVFFLQGGFGGGHLPYDYWLYLLGMPSILILEYLPMLQIQENSDLLLIIFTPLLCNTFLWYMIGMVVSWAISRKQHHNEAVPSNQ